MFPNAKKDHKEAIKLRVADVEQITESLYSKRALAYLHEMDEWPDCLC